MTENIKIKHELNQLPRVFIKAAIVIAIALIPVFLMNFGMQSFLDDELASVQAAAEKAELAKQALLAADDMDEDLLKAELAILKANQYEDFYQKYKNRESFHYYGQFYEMFENVYNADTLFIGTSHASHGVNPLYVEESVTDRSFFNFALNGSNPAYYLDWYNVFKEAGYPTPDTIIFCVDWFMCDDGWLWRRISFDDNPDNPIDIMRKIRATQKSTGTVKAPEAEDTTAATEAETAPVEVVEAEKINFWDVDALMTSIFNKLPMIYSRDRIPEMIRHYMGLDKSSSTEQIDADTAPDSDLTGETEEKVIPEIPVYVHEFLRDGSGNITSDYYKGFIPWEVGYNGGYAIQGSNDTEAQWTALTSLLDKFTEDGIKLIFVQVPEHIDGRRAIKFEENNKRLSDLAEKYNAPFLNYNEDLDSDINYDHTNFSDWGHLNKKGSTAFSKQLGIDLAEILGER